ncbi:MAG: nicotinamide riboside transporter PnuC [Flavobacteriaceae bacterium]
MMSIIDFFLGPYLERSTGLILLELLAFVFGVWSVWMAKKANIWVYPTGIIGTTITMYLFFTDRLLGDMLMNAYYSLMSIYGWWEWSRQKDGKKVRQITTMNHKEKGIGLALVLTTMMVTYMVYRFTNTNMDTSNVIDIFTSGVFFTAMWLMARKKLESWILWISADLITIPLYAYRGWGMLSLQYLIFTILAFQGYYAWKESLHKS